jgi:hypothetical protein
MAQRVSRTAMQLNPAPNNVIAGLDPAIHAVVTLEYKLPQLR